MSTATVAGNRRGGTGSGLTIAKNQIANAGLIEGLRRLRDLGAGYATVISGMGPESEPARRLYASAGFEPVFTFDRWKKPD